MIRRKREIMAALDSIAKSGSGEGQSGAYDLVFKFATTPGRLKYLITRYSDSRSADVVGSIAACLNKKMFEKGFRGTLALSIQLASGLRTAVEEPRISLLSALAIGLERSRKVPSNIASLRDFLIAALQSRGPRSGLLHNGLLDILSALERRGWVDVVFGPADIPAVLEGLRYIVQELTHLRETIRDDAGPTTEFAMKGVAMLTDRANELIAYLQAKNKHHIRKRPSA